MIAIDTNVLLRYLLDDDPLQSAKARRLIAKADDILITDAVLVELIWTLTGKRYQLTRDDVTSTVTALFHERSFSFEDNSVVWRALCDYRDAKLVRRGGKKLFVDFSDALIANKASALTAGLGMFFEGFFTFDRAAQTLAEGYAP